MQSQEGHQYELGEIYRR